MTTSNELKLTVGAYSDRGRKEVNQDFQACYIPNEPQLSTKGIALALSDGISTSDVSQHASKTAVSGFFEDYFSTSETWSVKKSGQSVLYAINSWLYAQNRKGQYRYEKDRGYVCTFSALIIKSTTVHIFHIGDARIYRLRGADLELLTEDHRISVSDGISYLGRALGVSQQLDIDYLAQPVEVGDIYIMLTDGIYEKIISRFIVEAIHEGAVDLDVVAHKIAREAYAQGSEDNLSIQIVRIEQLPSQEISELCQDVVELPFPPRLEPGMHFDGYKVVREIHVNHRSHVFLAVDLESQEQVVMKIPSIELREDPGYVESFLLEEWVARRLQSPHVLKAYQATRKRHYIYNVMEYVEGQTLKQWMIDNSRPSLSRVRGVIDQVAKGLQAFHRMEMIHQDIRPENIMIDLTGTVKIIDFGSTRVAGLMEIGAVFEKNGIHGMEQYAAPEYFSGESGSFRSDIFSLGVMTYQMLTGQLPYGARVPRARTKRLQRELRYQPARSETCPIPIWVDEAIRKAVHPDPWKRYDEVSEFVYDLHHPNKAFLHKHKKPFAERNPVVFWKSVSLVLVVVILVLLSKQAGL